MTNPEGQHSNQYLAARARDGDRQAFSDLIARHKGQALRLARQLVADYDISQEMVQEATLQAFLSLPQLQDDCRFSGWYAGIVLNVCRSYLRRNARRLVSLDSLTSDIQGTRLAGSLLEDDAYTVVEARERRRHLQEAVRELSAAHREVMRLFYYEQRSLQDIARHLDISVVAVKSRLHKARLALKTQMQRVYPELETLLLAPTREKNTQKRRGMREVRIAGVRRNERSWSRTVLLLDEAGQQGLPLWVEPEEGDAIALSLRNSSVQRPQTHDLMRRLLEVSNTRIEQVAIERVADETYSARLRLRRGRTVQELDARPGDALALAIQTKSPIFVSEETLAADGLNIPIVDGHDLNSLLRDWSEERINRESGIVWGDQSAYPINLDFADGLEGWAKSAPNSDAPDYIMGLDTAVLWEGRPCPYLTTTIEQPYSYGCLMQNFRADAWRGKRLRFSACLKTENVVEYAGMWLRLDGRERIQAWNMREKPVLGTTDWKQYEYVLDVDEASQGIAFGIALEGKGKIWVNGFQFEEVGDNVPVSRQPWEPQERPENMDFAAGLEGWFVGSNQRNRFHAAVDTQITHEGKASVALQGDAVKAQEWGGVMKNIQAEAYRGQRVRLSGWLRTNEVEGSAELYLRADSADDNTLCYVDTNNAANLAFSDWHSIAVEMDVPTQSAQLSLGLILYGSGQAWASGLQFEIVSEDA